MLHQPIPMTPARWLATHDPAGTVQFFAPTRLSERLAMFRAGFPGLVTYAVKANPDPAVLTHLIAAGMTAFDVASPDEIAAVRALCPGAALHYHNPVRAPREIAQGVAAGVTSWAVDAPGELARLIAAPLPPGSEVAVRFRLPVPGAAYDFGAKFGATEEEATALLAQVAGAGFTPSLTFHVGTQCTDPAAWTAYMQAAARIARGRPIARLNVGGGFPSGRDGTPPDLAPFFAAIRAGLAGFASPPALVCEPGRGLVADAFAHAVRVKSLRDTRVYLEDGIYGGLSEFLSMPLPHMTVLGPDGTRCGAPTPRTVFGPTCDSLDRLPGTPALPADLATGDWIIWASMGAYVTGVSTRFNGYGLWETVTLASLDG